MNRPSPWRTPFARRTLASGVFWAAGTAISWLTGTTDQSGWLAIRTDPAGLLLTAAAIVGGANFAGAGLRAARTLKLDMNFLMTAALIGALLIGEPFEAATLAFLFSLAELLERYAVDRGRRSIERLLALAPDKAERLRADGSTELIPASELKAGDRIRVRPGGLVPADGRVVEGASAVNEAAITGESLPKSKGPGDAVFAATFNAEGSIDVDVTADAAHSTLARIVQLVREAESRRAPVEQAVKRFARIYTPAVVITAIIVMVLPPLAFQASGAEWFVRGLTLLVIACPCALVIATPVTVVSALTSAAHHGVLIKGGEYLETLGAIKALAVDKTGTLTTGELEVAAFQAEPAEAAEWLLRATAAIEARSEHPIGKALIRYAASQAVRGPLTVDRFSSQAGRGVSALVDGKQVLVGSETFVGLVTPGEPLASGEPRARVYVKAPQAGLGTFELQDSVRPAARDVVARLHQIGVRPVVLLTGDHAGAAAAVARSVGIDDVRARLMPEEKVKAVRELRNRYQVVGMVGDGVNDAPALAEASVGIAMGAAGSPATIETADVALMGDDLSRLPYAVTLGRRARRTIRFNIALALGLKLVLAIGAVTGNVSLAVAVLVGDMGGTLAVTLNALRLARTPVST